MRRTINSICWPRVAIMAAVGLLASAFASNALAQASFDFSISASEHVLASPNDPDVQHYEMWDSPLGRIIKNSRPFIEVRNTAAAGSNLQLTEFRMTIGDTQFNFSDEFLGMFAIVGVTTPDIAITSTVEMDGDELVIAFDDGLAPDEFVRFQIDLDSDDGLGLTNNPDHRNVFFDMFENDNSDNSQLTATFTNTVDDSTLVATGVQSDLNLPISALGQTVFTNGTVRPYSAMESVGVNGFEETPVIPEPTTAALAMLGLSAVGLARSRRRA